MKVLICVVLLVGCLCANGQKSRPFVGYSKETRQYLKRIQQGEQGNAFQGERAIGEWQKEARLALVKLIGLGRIRRELTSFRPLITEGKVTEVDGVYLRSLCEIETEPGVSVPFYLLVPK